METSDRHSLQNTVSWPPFEVMDAVEAQREQPLPSPSDSVESRAEGDLGSPSLGANTADLEGDMRRKKSNLLPFRSRASRVCGAPDEDNASTV